MAGAGKVFLMYHELELPGRPLCHPEESYARYAVSEAEFRNQLAALRRMELRGMSVGEALDRADGGPGVAITFDDGCETDWIAAAPLLREAECNATLYIVAGFLGRPGYLAVAQLRALADANFEVGCHSMSHANLSDLGADELRKEIVEAKDRLEQLTGRRIEHFSCPGGRWSPRVAELAEEAGYRSVTTSRIGTNLPGADPFSLARVVVLRGTSSAAFAALCRGEGLFLRRARDTALSALKSALGNSLYQKLRSTVLDRG